MQWLQSINPVTAIWWIFFNVILALVPLALGFFFVYVMKIAKTKWHAILKDGELYIFSTTLSASSIGTAIIRAKSVELTLAVIIIGLFLTLILSTALFALASSFRLTQTAPPDEMAFAVTSLFCAVTASILSFVAFTL